MKKLFFSLILSLICSLAYSNETFEQTDLSNEESFVVLQSDSITIQNIAYAELNLIEINKMRLKGKGMFAGGLTLTCTGGVLLGGGAIAFYFGIMGALTQSPWARGTLIGGSHAMLTGLAFGAAGIPLTVFGVKKMNKAAELKDIYIENHPEEVTLSLQSSCEGIGLALRF